MFEEGSLPTTRAPLKRGFSLDAVGKRNLFKLQDKQTSIDKVEYEQCKLEPKVENRIIILTDEVSFINVYFFFNFIFHSLIKIKHKLIPSGKGFIIILHHFIIIFLIHIR